MGTVREWREVLISGALWGTFMMLFDVSKHRAASKGPALYLNLLLSAIAAFGYGFGVVFGVRAFHWPLVTITMLALAAFVLVRIIYGKRMKRLQSSNPSISA